MWTIAVTALLLILACSSQGQITITRPLVGVDQEMLTVFCETSNPILVAASNLNLQVGVMRLPDSRFTSMVVNVTHREFRLRSLNRTDFTDLNGEGDNGMPLTCAFSDVKSNVSVVTVVFNDFVALSTSAAVINSSFVSILAGNTVRIPLNISARPADVVVTRAQGAMPASSAQVEGTELVFTNAQRSYAGSYNLTVTNLAGTTSAAFYLEVTMIPQFSLEDLCQPGTTTTSGLVTEVQCTVRQGDDVQLNCGFDSYPQGMLSLSYDGTDISTLVDRNLDISNNDTIVIMDFDPMKNGGVYECIATNTINGVAKETRLRFTLSEFTTTTMEPDLDTTTSKASQLRINLSSLLVMLLGSSIVLNML